MAKTRSTLMLVQIIRLSRFVQSSFFSLLYHCCCSNIIVRTGIQTETETNPIDNALNHRMESIH